MDIYQDPKLNQFASLISKLKALLKCPICLNVIEEAVELECHHKLCNTCYHDLSKAKLTCCPICKARIKKRCLSYKDNYSNAVGKFVSIMGLQLESVYKQKVETLAAGALANTSNSTSIGSKCFPKITNQIETNIASKENINMRELPVRQVKTSDYLKTNLKNQNCLVKSQHSSEGESFDKLLGISKNTIKFNRKSTRNVYTNRKKADKTKNENKVLDFEDDKNKEAVLNWLNDTRNQFDRLTQTQNMVPLAGEHGMAMNMNLPSVSQPKLAVTSVNMIEKKGRRAKSLDLENKKIAVSSKRYSYDHISDLDDYNIEDPNTEGIVSEEKVMEKAKENVILHLLEDELLDKMDHEMEAPDKITCDNEIGEKKIDVAGISLASCNSGWSRITEMKETVDKSGKLPKQLRITLQNMEKTNSRKKESVNSEHYKDHGLSGAKAKVHNPKHVEDGISKNIQCTNNPPIIKSCKTPANMTNNSQINVKTNMLPENESRLFYNACGDSPIKSTLVNGKDKLLKQTCVEKNNHNISEKSSPSGLHQNPNYISSLNNNQTENAKTRKSSIADQLTFGMMGQNTHHVDVLSNHDDADILKNAPDKCITKDVIVLHYSDNSANRNEHDEDLDDYDRPTQTVLGVDDSNKLRQSTNKLLSYINEYIQICSKEADSNYALQAIDEIKTYVDRLKQINVVNKSVQTSQISKQDVFVETKFQTCSEAVQTEGVSRNSRSVQTSEVSKNDAISQTDPSKSEIILENTLDRSQKKSQILDRNFTNTTLNKRQESEGITNDENELLTNSLDNVEFNTLDVVRNSSYKVGSNFDVEMKENDRSVNECDIPEKEVNKSNISVCQKEDISGNVNDQLLVADKEVIEKSHFGATHSNQKRSREETEMEETIMPKKKRNRFIMDVLSVEFDNTLDKEATQKRESFGEGSTEVNKSDSLPPSNVEKADLCWKASEKRTSNLDTDVTTIDPGEKSQGFRIRKPTKYLDEYDEIIAKVSENVERLTKQAQVARETNQHPMEKITSPVKNINTSKLEEFKQQFPGYSSDIISGTESVVGSPKKPKMKDSNEGVSIHHSTLCSPPNASQTNKYFDTKKRMEVCHELEDSFDEEFANIHFTAENNEDKPRVKILANIKIKSQNNIAKVGDDDLFSEEEDVVETTPQNRSPAVRYEFGADSNDVIEGENETGLDFPALPPPPAFQDGPLPEMETDETLKPDDSVHLVSPLNQCNRPSTSDFLCGTNEDSISANQREEKSNKTEVKNLIHSTPKTSKGVAAYTLGLSPIQEYTVSQTNSCAMKNTQKRNILTSTPRQISMWNYVKPSQSPQKIAAVSSNSAADVTAIEVINSNSYHITQAAENTNIVSKKPCISFTRLSKDQVMCISQMTSKKLATHTMTFDKSVTHMIVSVDKSGCAKDYTVKFMAAIASGIWVLKFDWVQKCLDTNSIVPEEPYEALDDTGGQGPRTARLTRLKDPLLRNFKFYITEPLFSTTRQDIEDIIKMLGGIVVSSPDQLKCEPGFVELIITEGRATQDFEIYDRWLEQYKVVTIDIEWLSKSVGRYKQISFRPYIWCSDETLDELNYPDHLVEIVPYSVDQ